MMEGLEGLFKICAYCSIKENRADLEKEQFYCKVKGGMVYGTTDASTCESFDWKNVSISTQNEAK